MATQTKIPVTRCSICKTIEMNVDGKTLLLHPNEYDHNEIEEKHGFSDTIGISLECYKNQYGEDSVIYQGFKKRNLCSYLSCKDKIPNPDFKGNNQ